MNELIAVTAIRNEINYLPKTVPSILNQTNPPDIYVIVDDGSINGSRDYLKKTDCLKICHNPPRINIRGINQVYSLLKGVHLAEKHVPTWKYLLKTDGDTYIPPHYVEKLIKIMNDNPKIGIIGGVPHNQKIRLSRVSDAAKIYSRKCWDKIGGLDIISAFDSHAIIKANQYGYKTESIPSIKFREIRPSKISGFKMWIQEGKTRKNFGLPLWHTILACMKNITEYPPIIGPLSTIFMQLIYPKTQAPGLDPEFVKKFATQETMEFVKSIWRQLNVL